MGSFDAVGRKIELIEMSGSRCACCEVHYVEGITPPGMFHFHHLDQSLKEFGLSYQNLRDRMWESVEEEWLKCVMLCGNCHSLIHADPHAVELIKGQWYGEENPDEY